MEQVLSVENMQKMDARAIEQLQIPSETLMEIAGARCADLIMQEYEFFTQDKVIILCGKGRNGGDGLVLARHLYAASLESPIVWLQSRQGLAPETQLNLMRCESLDIPILCLDNEDDLDKIMATNEASLFVDALYGIGFKGTLSESDLVLINMANVMTGFKISLDIPSGLNGNTGMGYSIKADATIAIGAYKYGNILGNALYNSGTLHLIDLGYPPYFFREIEDTLLFETADIMMPMRYADAHKGDYGKVLLFGSSSQYPGSIGLSARAALKSGAGLIYQYTRKEVWQMQQNPPEIISRYIPESEDGLPDTDAIIEILKGKDAIVIGPGMDTDEYALKLLKCVLFHTDIPVIVDADAINLISRHKELREYLKKDNIILTPHVAEFARLMNIKIESIVSDTVRAIKSFQAQYDCYLLLKSHISTRSYANGLDFIRTGNDALATGGSGDVLSGIIASFVAQKMHHADAIVNACLLMGKTAEKLIQSQKSFSICPSDIIQHLGDLDDETA